MIICPNCGKELADGTAHCGYCGHEIDGGTGKKTMFGMGGIDSEAIKQAAEEARAARQQEEPASPAAGDETGAPSLDLPAPNTTAGADAAEAKTEALPSVGDQPAAPPPTIPGPARPGHDTVPDPEPPAAAQGVTGGADLETAAGPPPTGPHAETVPERDALETRPPYAEPEPEPPEWSPDEAGEVL